LKERRKKIKEKKVIAIANAKKATKTVGIEPEAGDSSDTDGENHASKRSKLASRDPPAAKNEHRTSVRVQAKGRRILTDPGRNSRRETTKPLASEKSKGGRRMDEQTTPAH
jgi:hypothetical protein